MNWKKTTDASLPTDAPFLAMCGSQMGICEFNETEKQFYFVSEPGYAYAIMHLSENLMKRITHWAELPEKPKETNDI
ncbi:MAG: hypothetical protein ACE5GV_00380 [Candidatus Scalindua sp.]